MGTNETTELLPCPFCGRPGPVMQEQAPHSHDGVAGFMPDYSGSWTIECKTGNCCALIATKQADVIAAWNRRAALPPTSGEEVMYAIIYDEHDKRPVIVVGEQAARAHFARVGAQGFNAHFFAKLESNSRDDPNYSRNLAAPAAPVADTGAVAGWKLVPIEPTPKMVDATFNDNLGALSHNKRNRHIYAAMLADAPASPAPTADSGIPTIRNSRSVASHDCPQGCPKDSAYGPVVCIECVDDSAADVRCEYINRKHVMGSSYGGITSLNIIVHADDYAVGGALYAIDCMVEREQGRSGAAMSTNTGEGE